MNENLDERIARVRQEAEVVNVKIRQTEMRLREFAFLRCKTKNLAWDPKEKRIMVGRVPLLSLTYFARTNFCASGELDALILAAVEEMEYSLEFVDE